MAHVLGDEEADATAEPEAAADLEPGPRDPGEARGGLRIAERVLLTAAGFVVVVAGMHAAAPLVNSFLIAGFIAVIWAPLFLAMQRRGVPSGIALLVLLVLGSCGFGPGPGAASVVRSSAAGRSPWRTRRSKPRPRSSCR